MDSEPLVTLDEKSNTGSTMRVTVTVAVAPVEACDSVIVNVYVPSASDAAVVIVCSLIDTLSASVPDLASVSARLAVDGLDVALTVNVADDPVTA